MAGQDCPEVGRPDHVSAKSNVERQPLRLPFSYGVNAMRLDVGNRTLDLGVPAVMGIVNVTPDSFSDAGDHFIPDIAIEAAQRMIAAGARIIDIGGESTRPGATPVPAELQLERVLPVVEALRQNESVILSVDTGDAAVIRQVCAAGADMINDVFALRKPGALGAAGESGALVCLMHMQGSPATMQEAPKYRALPDAVITFLRSRLSAWEAAGYARQRLILDPGFGFGKNDSHNLKLLATLQEIGAIGLPLLVGLSRKATLGRLTGRDPKDRLAAGIAAAVMAVERGASIVRTHDVPATVDALRIVQAVRRFDASAVDSKHN